MEDSKKRKFPDPFFRVRMDISHEEEKPVKCRGKACQEDAEVYFDDWRFSTTASSAPLVPVCQTCYSKVSSTFPYLFLIFVDS